MRFFIWVFGALCLPSCATAQSAGEQQFLTLDPCPVETIEGTCELGYRLYGTLQGQGDNAVLAPTWLGGTSADFMGSGYIGPGKMLDPEHNFIIAVDAFGNGVSSSPSNTADIAERAFTIGEMVEAQYTLLTKHLGIERLDAIVGVSMGGMQAFEWMERYPSFVDKVSSVISASQVSAYDTLNWTMQVETSRALLELPDGEDRVYRFWSGLDGLVFRSPFDVEREVARQTIDGFLAANRAFAERSEIADRLVQIEAVLTHHAELPMALDPDERPHLQFVFARDDRAVTPFQTLELAADYGAEIVELPSSCGHLSLLCDFAFVSEAVAAFLDSDPAGE